MRAVQRGLYAAVQRETRLSITETRSAAERDRFDLILRALAYECEMAVTAGVPTHRAHEIEQAVDSIVAAAHQLQGCAARIALADKLADVINNRIERTSR